jgi:16S rRNA (cytosine1402-N4)-methyltransferase
MNSESNLNAINVINEYTEKELSDIFFYYGDFKDSKKIAKQIFNKRNEKEIISTHDLIAALEGLFSEKNKNKYLARIFQAIRIEVNDEINSLKKLLNDATELLKVKEDLLLFPIIL